MHEMDVRVYYEDTDFGGVVYYANYLKYIERGRTELLREQGVDQITLKDAGLVFVVRRVSAEYLSPARFDDLLTIETKITEVRHASVAMSQRVLRDTQTLFTAEVLIAVMNERGRPARLPPEIRENFVKVVQAT